MKKLSRVLVYGWVLVVFVLGFTLAQSKVKEVPQRSEIPDKYKWKLEHIYATDSLWEYDFSRAEKLLPEIENFKGHLAESGKNLLGCLTLRDTTQDILDRLYVYSFMKLDEDNRVSRYQELSDRASALWTKLKQATSFIEPEILSITPDRLEDLMKEDKGLKLYRHHIDDIARKRAHTLSAREEELLAGTRDMSRVPTNVFNMIENADLKFPSVKDEEGNEVELTHQRYYKFLESTDRRVRKDATDAYNQAYLNYLNTLGSTLAGSINKDAFYARTRNYNSSLEAALDADNIPTQVFENLVNTVNENLEPIHRYVSLRKKFLGLEEFHKYDMWVPLVPEAEMEIPYDSAVAIILDAMEPLGKKYVRELKDGFNSGWVDVYETQGKGNGAYSWGSYSTHPYMLLNYNNTLENVFTIAHEMGHCLHSDYSNLNQPYVDADYSLCVAEIASETNEFLLMDYLLKNVQDKDQRLYLINYYLEFILGTFYNQVMFAEFEKVAHEKAEKGEALSASSLRKIYGEIYQKYYGPDLTLDSLDDLSCLRISHFYRNFYVYKYATSLAGAAAFSRKILAGEKEALDSYLGLLKAGGSDYPIDIVKTAGVDMTSPEPVNNTVELFASLVDQMEKLLLGSNTR
ncbi:MAG: oligoendopeptidase F [Candidatus Zixiibacteriota bacterium]